MLYQGIQIVDRHAGCVIGRLSLGSSYKGFEVLQIKKTTHPEGLERSAAIDVYGTYSIVLKDKDGDVYEIANNQAPASFAFCFCITSAQIALVPDALDRLTWRGNRAEFSHPVATVTESV